MDPLSTVLSLGTAIQYLYTVSQTMRDNREECRRLAKHADSLFEIIKDEYEHGVPEHLRPKLLKLASALSELTSTLESLKQRSLLKRAIWRGDISSRIQQVYQELSEASRVFDLGSKLDMLRFQQENEEARRRDAQVSERNFKDVLDKEDHIIELLGIIRSELPQAMISISQHLPAMPPSAEKRAFTQGMYAMQRQSGPLSLVPDEFVITSLDVIIHHDKKLGEGGFGRVFRGDWHGTPVAVKIWEKGIPSSLVQQEVDVWKRLRHPNILEFFGACSVADPPFAVCALKTNGDALSYLRANPKADRRKLLHEASVGLVYLHQNSIVHGDLKAMNILIDDRGVACLSDFGLSKIKAHTTTMLTSSNTSQPQGTARWMAPEQMRKGVVNKASDIYSFGMTMYEVFTGVPPFGHTPDSILYTVVVTHCERPPRPEEPQAADRGLDDNLWEIIQQCWCDDPADRLSARELSIMLKRTLKTSITSTGGASSSGKVSSPSLSSRSRSEPSASRKTKTQERTDSSRDAESDMSPWVSLSSLHSQIEDMLSPTAAVPRKSSGSRSPKPDSAAASSNKSASSMTPGVKALIPSPTSPPTVRLTVPRPTLFRDTSNIYCVCISPDGRTLFSGADDGVFWNIDTGARLLTLPNAPDGAVTCAAFSPDGTRLVTGLFGTTVRVWDASTGSLLLTIEGHTSKVWAVAYTPDGARIVSGGDDRTLRIWDAASGALCETLEGHTQCINTLAVSPDGARIVSGASDRTLRVWDAHAAAPLFVIEARSGHIWSVAWARDSRRFVTGSHDNLVKIWDVESGAVVLEISGHASTVWSVVFSPDGRTVASGSADASVRIWDATDGKQVAIFKGHAHYINDVYFAPDGRRLVSASTDHTVRIWDVVN